MCAISSLTSTFAISSPDECLLYIRYHNLQYFTQSLHLLLLDSNETDGLIDTNVIWSHFIVRYTVEDSFIIGVSCDKKWGLKSWKAKDF